MSRLSPDDSREPSLFARYGVALVASALALLLTWLFQSFMQQNLFLWFFAAIVIGAWYGGLGPALLVTVIASLSTGYFFIPSSTSTSLGIGTEGLLRLGVFTLVALLISSLTAARRRSAILAQAQREQLRVTLASIGDAVIATDVQGRVTLMNAVAEALTGWHSADALGQPITDIFRIINETTRQVVESPVERALHEDTVVELANHTLLIARDGTERLIDDSGAPIRDRQGVITGVVLVFRDISARQQVEAAQARLAAIVQSSDDAIIGKTLDGTIISWNAGAERIYGYSAEETINRSIQMLAPPDRLDEIPHILERLRRGERIASLETTRVRKDGTLVPVSLTISPILDADGTITAASTIARDISERKQAADRSARLQAIATALSEALTPAQVADVVIAQGIAALGAQAGSLALLSADGTALELVGAANHSAQTLDSWRRFPLSQAAPLAEAVRSKTMILLESPAALAEQYPQLEQAQSDYQAWAAIPLLIEGRVSGALGLSFATARTFSVEERAFLLTLASQCAQALERARLYDAERQARARAEAAVHLRDQFLSIAAHELKTPLTSLLGYAQLFQRRSLRAGSLGEADQRALGVIVAQAARLNRMVAALLDIARIEGGQLSINRAPLDLCALARRVVEEAREQAEEHPLEITCAPEHLLIDGDDLRLEQVLQNLIQNAIKYSPPNTPVTVRIERQGVNAAITVIDHGIGIPEAALAQLFQRFYRAPNVDERQISGMGIGLFVVKEIVLLHGGTVAVESVEGQGSTFTIRLPLMVE